MKRYLIGASLFIPAALFAVGPEYPVNPAQWDSTEDSPAVVAEGVEIEIPRLVLSLGPLTLTIPQPFVVRVESVRAAQ